MPTNRASVASAKQNERQPSVFTVTSDGISSKNAASGYDLVRALKQETVDASCVCFSSFLHSCPHRCAALVLDDVLVDIESVSSSTQEGGESPAVSSSVSAPFGGGKGGESSSAERKPLRRMIEHSRTQSSSPPFGVLHPGRPVEEFSLDVCHLNFK